jgi:hypothetical protein
MYPQRPTPTTKQETIDYVKGLVQDGFAEHSIGECIVNRVPKTHAWVAFETAQEALKELREEMSA